MSKFNRIWGHGAVGALADWLWRFTKDEVERTMRRRVKPRFWLFMIAVTALVFLTSFAVLRGRYAAGAQRLDQIRRERDELVLQVNALSDQLKFAQTDDYVIRTARDELGMIMPGEVRYVNGAR